MKTNGEGIYVLYDGFIAFRDNKDSKWRINRIDINHVNSLVITLTAEFEHLWQVEEFVKKESS